MLGSLLDARFRLHLAGALQGKAEEVVRSVPGVSLQNRMNPVWLEAPLTAAPAVEHVLTLLGFHQGQHWQIAKVDPVKPLPRAEDLLAKSGHLDMSIWSSFAKPFQRECVDFTVGRRGGHVWVSPGGGKTLVAILFAVAGKASGECPRGVLVVTRSSVKVQWSNEVKQFTTGLDPYVWRSPSARRKKDATPLEAFRDSSWPLMIVGWPLLRDIVVNGGVLLEGGYLWRPSMVVFDESHRGKAPRRAKWSVDEDGQLSATRLKNTSAAAWSVASMADWRLCTTGTPVKDRLSDLYGQITLVEPMAWGQTATKFFMRYCDGKEGEFGGLEAKGESNPAELQSRLAYTAKVVPYTVSHAGLPPKIRQVIMVPADSQQRELVPSGWKKEAQETVRKAQSRGASSEVKTRCTEIRLMEAASRKRGTAAELAREYMAMGKGKVILFTGRKLDAEAYEGLFPALERDQNLWIAHGEEDEDRREEIRQAYMAHPGPCVLVATYQSMGESFNLHDTDALIVAYLPYTPGEIDQIEGRVHRQGIDRPVRILYLVAERSVDLRVKSIVLSKMPAVGAVLGSGSALEGLNRELKMEAGREQRMAQLVEEMAAWNTDYSDVDD